MASRGTAFTTLVLSFPKQIIAIAGISKLIVDNDWERPLYKDVVDKPEIPRGSFTIEQIEALQVLIDLLAKRKEEIRWWWECIVSDEAAGLELPISSTIFYEIAREMTEADQELVVNAWEVLKDLMSPPRSAKTVVAGSRGVAIGGSVSNAYIVTGSGNDYT